MRNFRSMPLLRQCGSLTALCFGLLLSMGVHAQNSGEIFLCTDDFGNRTFTNVGNLKNCKKLDVNPISTIPATKAPKSAPAAPTPADFPKIDANTQKDRDATRRQLIDSELRREQERLAELQKEYNNGNPERQGNEKNYQKYLDRVERLKQDIQRSTANIQELQREGGVSDKTTP